MHSRSAWFVACVMACTVFAAPQPASAAAALSVTVVDAAGAPLAGVVVTAEPSAGAPRAPPGQKAIMDQRNLMFVPDVLVVQAGTAVDFPNSDQVRHQVYSFSSAKTFQLALYAGRAHAPVVFDRPGLVTLGCNIHDWMVGHVYVSGTPHFATTGVDGRVGFDDLPAGLYVAQVWHPSMEAAEASTARTLTIARSGTLDVAWQLVLKPRFRPRRAPLPGPRGYR